jgi:hypothetical protein
MLTWRHLVYFLIGASSAALNAVVLAVMLRQRLTRTLPLFFSFLCFEVTTFFLLEPLYILSQIGNRTQAIIFFDTFWIIRVVSLFLGLLVVHEVIAQVLSSYDLLRKSGAWAVRLLAIGLVAVAVWTAVASPGTDKDRFLAGMFLLERSIRVVQVGLLVFLFLFSRVLGLSWRSYVFGVALGLGIFATCQLALTAFRSYAGTHGFIWNCLSLSGETFAAFTWTSYFLRPEKAKPTVPVSSHDMEQWNQALSRLWPS